MVAVRKCYETVRVLKDKSDDLFVLALLVFAQVPSGISSRIWQRTFTYNFFHQFFGMVIPLNQICGSAHFHQILDLHRPNFI